MKSSLKLKKIKCREFLENDKQSAIKHILGLKSVSESKNLHQNSRSVLLFSSSLVKKLTRHLRHLLWCNCHSIDDFPYLDRFELGESPKFPFIIIIGNILEMAKSQNDDKE